MWTKVDLVARQCFYGWMAVFALVSLVGCAIPQNTATPRSDLAPPQSALPAGELPAGWSQTQEPRTYNSDTLYEFMNGAADLYFTYGFESLAVGQYESAEDGQVQVEIYRTATDADAFGLFAYNAFGEPIDVGVEGRWASDVGLVFWTRRTFVQIVPRGRVEDEALRAFVQAVVSALPQDGVPPALIGSLPGDGLRPGSVRFFREQMALENVLWLGPENVLGLGPDTEGILGEYDLDGRLATLMLVAFPDARRAQDAQSGLMDAGVSDLLAAKVNASTLGAVFGQISDETAIDLVDRSLAATP